MNQVEFSLKILPFDQNLPNELAKLEKEGWVGLPGLVPAVTYIMFRNGAPVDGVATPQDQPAEGIGTMKINDEQVHIIRDGKPVPA